MDLAIGSGLGMDAATGFSSRADCGWHWLRVCGGHGFHPKVRGGGSLFVQGTPSWKDASYLHRAERWLMEEVLVLGSRS